MSSQSSSRNGGVGFLGLLTILFIGLKLTNHINWSWWWVLAPMWVPAAVLLGILVILAGLKLLLYWLEAPEERRARELLDKFDNYSKALRRRHP